MKILFAIIVFLAITFSIETLYAQTNTGLFSKRISSGNDDVEESQDGSYIYFTSSDLELVYDSYAEQGNQIVGMRFTGIEIPDNAEITNAWIQFTVDAYSTGACNLTIAGELSTFSQPFTSEPFSVSSRQKTLSQVNWDNIPEWPTAGIAGPDQRTPDIRSIINEIISADEWDSGNPITIIITGTGKREAIAYDGSSSAAPQLVIEYSTPVYSKDLKLKSIISPAEVLPPASSVNVEICISNEGSVTQTDFVVNYSLDQGEPVMEEVSGITINPGDSLIYTFTTPIDLSITGNHSIETQVILSGDENILNNNLQKNILVEFTHVDNIHWGSVGNTLNGLTVSWKSPGQNDSIAWGYSNQYLNGKFKPHKHSGYTDNFFDYTFPVVQPSSEIHYAIYNSAVNNWTNDYVYQTSCDTLADHFTFTVAGDSRTNIEDWQQVADAMPHNEFTLFMGDIVENGSSGSQWDNWMEFGKSHVQNNLIYHQYGNHDVGYGNYENIFVLPQNPSGSELYYAFTFGNAIFISLNSQDPAGITQYNWLLSTLETYQNKEWKIVFFHKPFFSCGGHENEMDAYFSTWWKAFDDYGVDIIFNGHAHNYQRTNPINRNVSTTAPVATYGGFPGGGRCQIVSGGAGAPIHSVSPNQWYADAQAKLHYCTVEINRSILYFKAFDKNGQEIDELTINKEYTVFQLPAGWSGFSTFQIVSTPEVSNMFTPLNGNFIIINDFENVFWPASEINTFGNWNTKSGVQIKLSEAAEFRVYGQNTTDTQVLLTQGWQYLPVLSTENVLTLDIFGPVLDRLIVLKDIGGTQLLWPDYNINTLSVLQPGKSYLLKMSEPATIEYLQPFRQSGLPPFTK